MEIISKSYLSLYTLKSNYNNYENFIKINLSTKVDLAKELIDKQNKKYKLNEDIKIKIDKKKKIEEEILSVEITLSKITGELHRLYANKDMLIKLEKQYEGYNFSVRKIMERIEAGKVNIDSEKCTLLGKILKTNKEYETAIEVSLGGAISNVITDDDKTAKILINYLKKHKLGRVTFLPLSIIRGKRLELSKNISDEMGFIGIGCDLVEYEETYRNIINYILGKTIICDNIDNALKLAKKLNYKHKIVTLSGEVINSGGALTGGSIQQRGLGIISRKSEVENLENKIKNTEFNKSNILNNSKNLYKNKKDLEEAKEKLTEEVHDNNLLISDIKNKINGIDNEIIKTRKASVLIEEQLKSYDEKSKINIENVNSIEKRVKNIETTDIKNKQVTKNIDNEIIKLSEKIIKIKDEIIELKIKKAKSQEFIQNQERDIIRLKNEEQLIKNKIQQLYDYILENESSEKQSHLKIEQYNKYIENEKNELLILEDKAKQYELDRVKLKEELRILESTLEILTVEIAKKHEEIHRNEIIYTKQDNEKNNYIARLKEEYNTDFEEEVKAYEPIENLEVHKAHISKLKNKLLLLGSVNVNSIEEFKDILGKYRFIVTEKDDLEKAQEQLLNVIDEMTSKMRVLFRQNFNILNKYFDETFKELFKGGRAKLILQDGDELVGNIEINVQPPGKKVQNINLMSGGEKVLSAIAILFAILKMKPTPFCILDEIEAALDDANVNRYAEFLKKFSGNIQFIVITHRKGTMEVADIMYGVTMEEKGISKLVSVDLGR